MPTSSGLETNVHFFTPCNILELKGGYIQSGFYLEEGEMNVENGYKMLLQIMWPQMYMQ